MREKQCIACGETKPITEFYIHKQMKDGLLNKCKDCCKRQAKQARERKVEYYRAYDRSRVNTRAESRHRRTREEIKATNTVSRAVKNGSITRPESCEVCGKTHCRICGHHDDHEKTLDVVWLCDVCHARRHVDLGRVGKGKRPASPGPYRNGGRTLQQALRLAGLDPDLPIMLYQ